MPYPRELLNEGEELALDLRPHWWYFARHFLGGFLLIVVLVGISFVPAGSANAASGSSDSLFHAIHKYAFIIWFIAVLIWALLVLAQYLQWTFTQFVVTSDRIIFRTGVIAKRGVEIPLERINNINFGQTIFERIIGAGTLEIESAGEDGQSLFKDVRHPDAVQQEIYRCMEANVRKTAKYTSEGMQGFAGSNQLSIPEQIEKLAQLRDQNVITEAEFEEKKQILLSQM
jgi:uncharacterized membrane protein YdbT with pleckstrin-like domain